MRIKPFTLLRPWTYQVTHHTFSRRLYATQRQNPDLVSSSVGLSDPVGYCTDLVRKHDYESYLISQLWPRDLRGSYFALKAFSVELAMVQDHVSNLTIGKMRMQFWRDAVKDISNGRPPRHHPIALALFEATQRTPLQPYHFKRIIDARDAELETTSYQTIDQLIAHSESTHSTLLYLLLSLLPSRLGDSHALSHCASHLGNAQTIAVLLRALPYHSKQGQSVIPAEITSRHGVRQEEVFRKGPEAQGIDDAVFEFATLANDHMITARSMLKDGGLDGKVPTGAMPVFLAGVPVANFLQRLEKNNFNAFDLKLQLSDWKLPWQIYRAYFQGRF
ncbi:NADH dehydrogenase (ubiquinone) complex I, assembly factor 6 [Leucoagaricus sp. SymC.cos]|nr:NADH dehydrogenase (ubiquinone) complex I, assembly factor 6 [Leucoagaricus sp. SymC.cos]